MSSQKYERVSLLWRNDQEAGLVDVTYAAYLRSYLTGVGKR